MGRTVKGIHPVSYTHLAEGDLHTLLVVGIGWQFPPVQRGKRDMAQDTAPLIQRSGVEQIP